MLKEEQDDVSTINPRVSTATYSEVPRCHTLHIPALNGCLTLVSGEKKRRAKKSNFPIQRPIECLALIDLHL